MRSGGIGRATILGVRLVTAPLRKKSGKGYGNILLELPVPVFDSDVLKGHRKKSETSYV